MNILLYFNWSKATFLATELRGGLHRKATIATTTHYDIQRIATDKDELLKTNQN